MGNYINLFCSFIANMHFSFQDYSTLYLVLDYLEGGNLRNHLIQKGKFTEDEIKFAAWAGASGICSFGNFRDKWISKSDYEEHGPQIFEQNYIFG